MFGSLEKRSNDKNTKNNSMVINNNKLAVMQKKGVNK